MIVWVALAAMTIAAVAFVVVPLMRRSRDTASRASFDLEVYRDQLAEIDRDMARGLLDADQAEAARAEIGRRALAAAEGEATVEAEPPRASPIRLGAAISGVAVCLAAAGIYVGIGSPHLPGQPASERADRDGPDLAAAVAQLAARMEQNPENAEGWALLGRSLLRLRRFEEGARAYGRAAALRPQNAELRSLQGEALVFAGDRVVTPAARRAFDAARAIDPKEPRARYYIGLAALQAGKSREAFDLWRALEAESPPNAPWLPILRPRIERLAQQLGVELPDRPQPPRGPTAEDVRNAQSMSQSDRAAMIRSMVSGLAARLEEEPDDFDGWMRLGRSYGVLGERAKSRDAYKRAAALKPKNVQALSGYAAAIAQASQGDVGASAELAPVVGRLLDLDPNHRVGLWLAGAVAQARGRLDDTRRHWTRLLELLPAGSAQYEDLKRQLAALDSQKKP